MDTLEFVEMEFPWLLPAFAFVMGAIVGSFLNVCIYRIPAEKSIVTPGSTCACGQPIKWHDNLPIISWLILRGKARCCDQSISVRYPFVEALTGALFLLSWLAHPPASSLCMMLFASMLICGSFIDLDHMEIPNRFTIGLAAIGFALSGLVPQLHGFAPGDYAFPNLNSLFNSLLGILVGSATLLWIGLLAEVVLRKEAMGFGDVKLLGGIGAFLGWQGAIFSIFGGAFLGCLALMVLTPIGKLRSKKRDAAAEELIGRRVPYGPMLSGGALLYALFLDAHVLHYFENFRPLFEKTSY